jgi:hypothetical protein
MSLLKDFMSLNIHVYVQDKTDEIIFVSTDMLKKRILFLRRQSGQAQMVADNAYGECCNADNTYASKNDLCQSFLERRPVCTSQTFVASGAGA